MQAPRFFTGLALLFWGWQTDVLWIGFCLCTVLEMTSLTKIRFKLAPEDFNKFVDISTMFLAAAVVIALTIDSLHAAKILLKWMPVVLFPIIAAQQFSETRQIDVRSFFLMARKKSFQQFYDPKTINISYIYACIVIFSSASANTNDIWFFAGICFFSAWGLFQHRSKRFFSPAWIACLCMIIFFSYTMNHKIKDLGVSVTHWLMEYYADYYSASPFKNLTAMGDIGRLKLSNKIVLRLLPPENKPIKSILLHQATYNRFAFSTWFSKSDFTPIPLEPLKPLFWQINPWPKTGQAEINKEHPPSSFLHQVTIYAHSMRSQALLALPPGPVAIDQMKADHCEKNRFQTIRISDVPPLIKAQVFFTNALTFDPPPDQTDLLINKKERPWIEKFSERMKLEGKSKQNTLNTLQQIFSTQFTYSLDLKGKGRKATALQNFLLHTRSGHCELFATATVLILRHLGIPARYATGYIAHETSDIGGQMIIRRRDAHAWVKVFINGHWKNFDTTPPSFLQVDSEIVKSSWAGDMISWIGFKLSVFRYETGKDLMERYGFWLILPLGLILIFRLKKKGSIKRIESQSRSIQDKPLTERNDAFQKLEKFLSSQGFARYPFESLIVWHRRIKHCLPSQESSKTLEKIIHLYYQNRFGRTGLTSAEHTTLNQTIDHFLKSFHPGQIPLS